MEKPKKIQKTEVKKMFLIDNLKFEISKGQIVDNHWESYEKVPTGGGVIRKAFSKPLKDG